MASETKRRDLPIIEGGGASATKTARRALSKLCERVKTIRGQGR